MRQFSVFILAGLLLGPVVLTGCSGSRAALDDDELNLLREDLEAAYTEIERLRAENQELDYRLRQSMDNQSNNGERGTTVAIIPTDILFESGSAELSPQGTTRLAEIAGRLQREYAGRTIRIEGSTDDRPIGPNLRAQYPSNWELSAARAAVVARYLQSSYQLEGRRIEIVGLSEYHPTATNETAEGRQQNRRVRIAVMD